MKSRGDKAVNELGLYPENTTSKHKKFNMSNFGQWAPVLFDGLIVEFIPPCGLHLILANHRYLSHFMYDVISKRAQEHVIPGALRKIGCTYLAFQIESYFKSKKKHYDGAESLKMIGNDCKIMEQNIDTFLNVFVADKEDLWSSAKSEKIRQILHLYQSFADLERDIRSLHVDEDRLNSFEERTERYFQMFMHNAGTNLISNMPYLHYLRKLMVLYKNLFGWGVWLFFNQCRRAPE